MNETINVRAVNSKQIMDVDDELNTSKNSSLENAEETHGVMQMQPMSLDNPNILNHLSPMHASRQLSRDMGTQFLYKP